MKFDTYLIIHYPTGLGYVGMTKHDYLVRWKDHIIAAKYSVKSVDLVFDLQTKLSELQTKFDTMRVVATIEFGAPVEIMQVEQHHPKQYQDNNPFRQGSAQYNIINCLSHQYKSTYDIVKESGVHLKYVATTLSKAKRLGCAELGLRGMWRCKS